MPVSPLQGGLPQHLGAPLLGGLPRCPPSQPASGLLQHFSFEMCVCPSYCVSLGSRFHEGRGWSILSLRPQSLCCVARWLLGVLLPRMLSFCIQDSAKEACRDDSAECALVASASCVSSGICDNHRDLGK